MDPYWIARNGRLLGNGRYRVFLDARGGGVSFWEGVQLSAWEPDPVLAAGGWWIALQEEGEDSAWFTSPGPPGARLVRSRIERHPATQVYCTARGRVRACLEVWVDAERDFEVRRLTVQNSGLRPVRLLVTSCADVVLNDFHAHRAHPAFSKLFVQSEWDAELQALCFRRRPRSAEEHWPVLALMVCERRACEWESERAKCLGRYRTIASARAFCSAQPLSGSAGSVLDPTAALRQRLLLAPGERAQVTFVAAVAATRSELRALLASVRRASAIAASRERSDRAARQWLQQHGLGLGEALDSEEVAVALQYGCGAPRLEPVERRQARVYASQLGGHSAPLLLWNAEPSAQSKTRAARLLALWQARGFAVDAVVRAEGARSAEVWQRHSGSWVKAPHWAKVPPAVLRRMAACTIPGPRLALLEPLKERQPKERQPKARYRPRVLSGKQPRGDGGLELGNGYGGFEPQSADYVILLQRDRVPPMPWANVIANPSFGCLVSERGTIHTWGQNSREWRLTPWSNDPVGDPFAQALYVRDEQRGVFWSPLPGPAPSAPGCVVRHSRGFSEWRSECNGLVQAVRVLVAAEDPVQLVQLDLENPSTTRRELSVWWYAQLVLGDLPEKSRRWVSVQWESRSNLLLAERSDVEQRFSRVAFATASGGHAIFANGCRQHFFGVGGSLGAPRAVCEDEHLVWCGGDHSDPAFVLQVRVTVPAQARAQVVIVFGEARDRAQAALLARKYARRDADTALREVQERWRALLAPVEVRTPVPALDRLLNPWSLYQALSCRLWGRTAFYQSGGAFGFRDQLQDATALLWVDPSITREQILLHASHQFPEGDVLHWWHPPWERGTRTRFSDDLLWLPWAVNEYCAFTGDVRILQEPAPFVCARDLEPGEDEAYLAVQRMSLTADLYLHCCLAIERALTRGAHGLPLMGTGDWNDGMNRVGRLGKGESVWLGFFLTMVIERFVSFCVYRGDRTQARRYQRYLRELRQALETAGWDGRWYRRAYYDDGSPLGSASNQECRIDALVQAWAVISGVAPPARANSALDAVNEFLVDPEAGLIRLLAPPFDRDPHDPGYIKGYLPGIRENGGQYTHAALWVVQAFALLGRRNEAGRLLERLLPQWHARDPQAVERYQVEPYVVAADIYGAEPHRGRGGWTWYTGSAGWLFRVAVETILGLRIANGMSLVVSPRIPDWWPGYEATVRPPGAVVTYRVRVENQNGCAARIVRARLDGRPVYPYGDKVMVPLLKDSGEHELVLELGY